MVAQALPTATTSIDDGTLSSCSAPSKGPSARGGLIAESATTSLVAQALPSTTTRRRTRRHLRPRRPVSVPSSILACRQSSCSIDDGTLCSCSTKLKALSALRGLAAQGGQIVDSVTTSMVAQALPITTIIASTTSPTMRDHSNQSWSPTDSTIYEEVGIADSVTQRIIAAALQEHEDREGIQVARNIGMGISVKVPAKGFVISFPISRSSK